MNTVKKRKFNDILEYFNDRKDARFKIIHKKKGCKKKQKKKEKEILAINEMYCSCFNEKMKMRTGWGGQYKKLLQGATENFVDNFTKAVDFALFSYIIQYSMKDRTNCLTPV